MTPDFQNSPREELEARLTALLLGELPANEAFALGRMIVQDAELGKTYERLKQTIKLVKETEAPVPDQVVSAAPMKLSAKNREALLQQFKTLKPKAFAEVAHKWWRQPVKIAAAIVILAVAAFTLGFLITEFGGKSMTEYSATSTLAPADSVNDTYSPSHLTQPAPPMSAAPDATTSNAKRSEQAQSRSQHPSSPVHLGDSSVQSFASRTQTGVGSFALDSEAAKKHEAPNNQNAPDDIAHSVAGAGGSGSPTEKSQMQIVLPASNEAVNLGMAPGSTDASYFAWQGGPGIVAGIVGAARPITNFGGVNRQQNESLLASGNTFGSRTAGNDRIDSAAANNNSSRLAWFADSNRNNALLWDDFSVHSAHGPAAVGAPALAPEQPVASIPQITLSGGTAGAPDVRFYGLHLNHESAADLNGAVDGTKVGKELGAFGDKLAKMDFDEDGVLSQGARREPDLYNEQDKQIQRKSRSTESSDTKNSIILPAAPAEFSFNTATPNYKKDTIYRDRSGSASDLPRGATALMESNLGEKTRTQPLAAGESNRTANIYSLGVVGYANITADISAGKNEEQDKGKGQLPRQVAAANPVLSAEAASVRPYLEAKRKLDELHNFNELLTGKFSTESVEDTLPQHTVVELTDAATPSTKSTSSVLDKLTGKPAHYESTARLKVNRESSDIGGPGLNAATAAFDPYFIQTEFETIQSTQVLGRVVQDLHLDEKWAKDGRKLSSEQAVRQLKGMLDVKAGGGTAIDVGVKDTKADEAADVANSVAKAYADYRQQQTKALSTEGIALLRERMIQQQRNIKEQEKKVDELRRELKIPDSITRTDTPALVAQNAVAAVSTNAPKRPTEEDKPLARPATPLPTPQPEVQATDNPFSSFSLNVSDVSFKLAAASLEKGALPDPGSIRSEEFINAFDYRDPEPPANVPVAFVSERAQYPFAQNRDLLRFSIKTAAQGRESGKPLNLVLLVDNSGSMERADRVRILRESLRVLAGQLKKEDKLSIVTFARTPHLRFDGLSGDHAGQAFDQVSGLTPEGGTNLEEGMNLAYQTASRHYLTNGINRVVLMTDGAANLGDVTPESLKQKVETNRQQGIALDCFGIGWEGYNDDLLEALSRNGDGRYGFINTPEEAASEFAGQLAGALHVAASDVKVQVEFNPKRVSAYRQIGYARHQLTKEQFRDNRVDAAEIGAAEAGNALYVIQSNPSGEGPIGTVRVRFRVPGTSDYREHEWVVAYAGSAVPLEQSSPAMRLAATASAFSEWLAASPYAGEVTPDALLRYLSGVPDMYGADGRPKKLEWMMREAKALAGK